MNWNRRQLLRACLESVRAQSGVNLEIIVVDNGSGDGSLDMIEQEFSGGPGPLVRTIANPDNRGFCAANNQGIAVARGEWVALLNNDAEAEPGWLAGLLAAANGRPETGMVACKILVYEDPTRIDKAGHLIYLDGQNRGRGTGQTDRGQFDRVEEVLWPDGCAALYRRSMLEQIGGFDEDFFAYADDAELGMRARIAGWRCIYTPHAVVRHHRGSTLGLLSMRRLILIERNRVLFAVKLFPWSLLWINAGYLLARICAGLWAGMRGQGEVSRFRGLNGKLRIAAALVMGNLLALPLLPRMLRKRLALKPLRRLTSRQVRRLLIENRISLRDLMEQAN